MYPIAEPLDPALHKQPVSLGTELGYAGNGRHDVTYLDVIDSR